MKRATLEILNEKASAISQELLKEMSLVAALGVLEIAKAQLEAYKNC
jgi:enoyl-[acyl-carrier-protein] reductase (NADH)